MPVNKPQFTISERKLFLRLFDVVFAVLGIVSLSYIFDFHYFKIEPSTFTKYIVVLSMYILLFGQIFEMYNLRVANNRYLILRSTLLTGVLTTLFYVFTPILTPELPENRIQILYFFLGITIPIYIWRTLYILLIFSPVFFNRILIISSSKENILKLINLIHKSAPENKIVGYISPEKIDGLSFQYYNNKELELADVIKNGHTTEVVIDSFESSNFISSFTPQLISLFKKSYKISSFEKFISSITNRVPKAYLNENFYNYISFSKSQENRIYLLLHRIFDVVGSFMGLLFLLILIPFIFLGNLVGNRGALFYLQERVGKAGANFKIIKFRTMIKNAENGEAVWAVKDDARVTKFGKFLRRTRLDEVPQFINIFKGDMSIIGPRPERPEFVEELSENFPFYTIRNVIKPGLTGWAQVEYPYASTKQEQYIKLRYDLYYIKERNLLMDFKIIIKTVSTVLFFRGT